MLETSAPATSDSPPIDGAVHVGGPPDPTLRGRWTTTTRPPPSFLSVIATLARVSNGDSLPSRKTVIKAIRNIDGGKAYSANDAAELYEFLASYAAIEQLPDGRWAMNALRCQELEIAIANCKPLPYAFVATSTPGEACGCPQPANSVVPPNVEEVPVAKAPVANPPKAFVVKRAAYMTASEIRALEAIDVCQTDTVVGEPRSPVHMSDEVFLVSELGKYFGGGRELFVVELRRLVNAGIVEIRKCTGPGGEYDTLVLTVPYEELKLVMTPIVVRHPIAVPRHVVDVIDRILALEGLSVSRGGLHATVRASVVARLKSRGVAAQPDKLADVITHRMIRHNPAALEKGWGLAVQGRDGVDAMICYPGLTPVEFVPIARDVFAGDVETEQPVAQSAPPRLIAVSDVGEGMSEVDLDLIIAEAPVLLEAAKAEKERRVEAARVAAEAQARVELRLELQKKRKDAAEALRLLDEQLAAV